MSMYFREHGKIEVLEFGESRTIQSFKDETDIVKILRRAQVTGSIDHLAKHGGSYGDFSEFDFHETQTKMAEGLEIFSELPSEVRNEFGNDVGKFFEYVNRPENEGQLHELLPAIAEPGSYDLDMSSNTPPGASKEVIVQEKAEEVIVSASATPSAVSG